MTDFPSLLVPEAEPATVYCLLTRLRLALPGLVPRSLKYPTPKRMRLSTAPDIVVRAQVPQAVPTRVRDGSGVCAATD